MSTPEESVEHPWGFEQAGAQETATKISRDLFRLDGMIQRILEAARGAMNAVQGRGPEDYDESEDRRRYNDLLDLLVNRTTKTTWNNGDGDEGGNKRLLGWILTLMCLLVAGGVTGIIVMYGEASSLRATVTQWQLSSDRRMDQIERRIDRLESQRP